MSATELKTDNRDRLMSPDGDDDDKRDHHYKKTLRALQIELVKLQRHLIAENCRVLIILEGRDGAGKDGTIKRLTEHMSPRETRVHVGPPDADLQVQVGAGSPVSWQDWTLADDLPATAGDFYLANAVTGEIVFGNYDDQASGQADGLATVGHGSIPPAGSQVRAARYRYVSAGATGNVAPAQVTVLGVPVPGITNVSNLGPGLDGADEEPIEDTLRRAPEELKIRDRAVTADDYEFLAREASNDVRIVRCLTPRLQAAVAPGPAPAGMRRLADIAAGMLAEVPHAVTVLNEPDGDLVTYCAGAVAELEREVVQLAGA